MVQPHRVALTSDDRKDRDGEAKTPAAEPSILIDARGTDQVKMPLVIYSAQGYDAAVTKAFTAATGIPVKLRDGVGDRCSCGAAAGRSPEHRLGPAPPRSAPKTIRMSVSITI